MSNSKKLDEKDSPLLKGNFKTKKEVKESRKDKDSEKENLTQELRKKALASLGGSMVYMERSDLMWDGEDE